MLLSLGPPLLLPVLGPRRCSGVPFYPLAAGTSQPAKNFLNQAVTAKQFAALTSLDPWPGATFESP